MKNYSIVFAIFMLNINNLYAADSNTESKSVILPQSAVSGEMAHANHMFQIAFQVTNILTTTHDIKALDRLMTEDVEIILINNGKRMNRTKHEYLNNVSKAFENNIKGATNTEFSVALSGPNSVKAQIKSIEHRKGQGRMEAGVEGVYDVNASAQYAFRIEGGEPKISQFVYDYTKTLVLQN